MNSGRVPRDPLFLYQSVDRRDRVQACSPHADREETHGRAGCGCRRGKAYRVLGTVHEKQVQDRP